MLKYGIIAVVALAVGVLVGRFLAPKDVETREVEKTVYKDRIEEKVVEVKGETEVKRVVVFRDRIISPDGTIREHEEERSATDTTKTETKTEVKIEYRDVEKFVDKIRIEKTPLPNWRVGALVGAPLELPVTVAYGAIVERRILGPISVGVWGLAQPQAGGLSLTIDF